MRLKVGLLALTLAACSTAPQATSMPSLSPTPAPTSKPTPIVFIDVNYLDQTGSHFIVRLDITNHGSVRAIGYPLIRLYWKELYAGTLCGDRVSVEPGASIRTQFERLNGPAVLSDHQDLSLVSAC